MVFKNDVCSTYMMYVEGTLPLKNHTWNNSLLK